LHSLIRLRFEWVHLKCAIESAVISTSPDALNLYFDVNSITGREHRGTEHDQQSAISNHQATISDQRSAIRNQRSAISKQQSAIINQQSPITFTISDQQPPIGTQKTKSIFTARHTCSAIQPAVGTGSGISPELGGAVGWFPGCPWSKPQKPNSRANQQSAISDQQLALSDQWSTITITNSYQRSAISDWQSAQQRPAQQRSAISDQWSAILVTISDQRSAISD
jgi:hypothetical protein